ncbi:MAG: hypothetical protein IPM01_20250 [Burkholderiaceae bacterium]|nr:hypothetical protein [Burkholderiaceae bacterium]
MRNGAAIAYSCDCHYLDALPAARPYALAHVDKPQERLSNGDTTHGRETAGEPPLRGRLWMPAGRADRAGQDALNMARPQRP